MTTHNHLAATTIFFERGKEGLAIISSQLTGTRVLRFVDANGSEIIPCAEHWPMIAHTVNKAMLVLEQHGKVCATP